jgi:hypothetical protein
MEDRRELSDVLNWREICFWRFWNLSELRKMFPWKSITKIPTPIFSLDFQKSIYWYFSYIFMRSDKLQNLHNKSLLNLRHHSTLYDLPFQSYDQSKNVTVWHSDPSVTESFDILYSFSNMSNWIFFNILFCHSSIYYIRKKSLILIGQRKINIKTSDWSCRNCEE